jgi:hypothetical protein
MSNIYILRNARIETNPSTHCKPDFEDDLTPEKKTNFSASLLFGGQVSSVPSPK